MERYVDALTGEKLAEKPEHMTQLYGSRLISKAHPRIEFRGKLDSLIARTLEVQLTAREQGEELAAADLQEIVNRLWRIMAAEVREELLPDQPLLGMDAETLRQASQNVRDTFGMEHPAPDCTMGRLCVELNSLRAQVREAEVVAVRALPERLDLLRIMNRLSSAVYVIFCRKLSGWYETTGK